MLRPARSTRNRRISVILGLAGLVGCQLVGGITERSATHAGASCLHNSDCAPDQACLFQVCAVRCVTDVDCHAGEVCLGTENGTACVTPGQSTCGNDQDCPGGTRCTSGTCHTDCAATGAPACREDQTCGADGVCVSLAPPAGGAGGTAASNGGTGASGAGRGGSTGKGGGSPGGKGGTGGSSGADPGTGGTEMSNGGSGATSEPGGAGGEPSNDTGGTGGSKGGSGGAGGSQSGTGGAGVGGSAGQSMAGAGGGIDEPPRLDAGSAQSGFATRYWDCCKPSCGWTMNAMPVAPLKSCSQQDTVLSNVDAKSSCDGGGPAYLCSSQAPWAVSATLAYGFAAASGVNYECGRCFQLQFDGLSLSGPDPGAAQLSTKTMIVQVINNGNVTADEFDLLIPGGGIGNFNSCPAQWGKSPSALGAQYGGLATTCAGDVACLLDQCDTVLSGQDGFKEGCDWSANWLRAALNPGLLYAPITCPTALTDVSGLAEP